MALLGTEVFQVQGVSPTGGLSPVTQQVTTGQVAALAVTGGQPTIVNNNLTTVGAGTLTAALLVARLITRTGPTSAFTDTTDTAANIIAALPALAVVGESFEVIYVNNTAYTATLTGGANVTISNITTVGANSTTRLLLTYSTASTITLYAVESDYNTFSGANPPTEVTLFGSGTGTFPEEGNIYRDIKGAATNPAGTAGDYVLATFTIPANSFDINGRGIAITACGGVASNTNSKRVKIYYNCTTATVGSTVTGGIVIADSGAYTTTGAAGWQINAQVFNTSTANTQLCLHESTQIGAVVSTLVTPQTVAGTTASPIIVAITGNAATTATDILYWFSQANAMN